MTRSRCLAAIRLAVAYRTQFGKDFLIDLIGYRRWGHNEGDDPSFTPPRTYAIVEKHSTVREQFAADLVRRGVVRDGDPEAFLKAGLDEFQRIRESVRRQPDGRDQVDGKASPVGVARQIRGPAPGPPPAAHLAAAQGPERRAADVSRVASGCTRNSIAPYSGGAMPSNSPTRRSTGPTPRRSRLPRW